MRRTEERLKALEEEQKRIQVSELNLPLCLEFLTQEIELCRKELSGDCGGDDEESRETMTEPVGGQSDVEKQKQSHSQPQKKLKRVRTPEFGGSDGKDSESFSLLGSKIIHGDDKDRAETITESVAGQSESENQKQSQSQAQSSSLSLSLSLAPSQAQSQSLSPSQAQPQCQSPFLSQSPSQAQSQSPSPSPSLSLSLSLSQAQSQSPSQSQAQSQFRSPSQTQSQSPSLSQSPSQAHRKQNPVWTDELEGKFERAIQELGGSDVAKPKEIRDIMLREDDDLSLTIIQIKSHLQNYRLKHPSGKEN